MKGLELNESFYNHIVAEILKSNFPSLEYSAALIGWGSEVLGFDDEVSTDHNWGLRFQTFLSAPDYAKRFDAVNQVLNEQLPAQFQGFPTGFEIRVNRDQRGDRKDKRIKHNIDVETIEGFFSRYLGCQPDTKLSAADWLAFPDRSIRCAHVPARPWRSRR